VGLISDETIRRVRDASDIAAVIESYGIQLKRSGQNLLALCPFHDEKTPSFNVNPRLQIFKCFGCDVGGDVFKFVQLMERATYPEAVETLAQRAGIPVVREGGGPSPTRDTDSRKAVQWVNSRALAFFEERLQDERAGEPAREYLLGRGFTKETIADWRLGWAPPGGRELLQYLVRAAGEHKREKVIAAAKAAGLLRSRGEDAESEDVYAHFRGRVMFPIFDAQHRPVGFGGRLLAETEGHGGKYINTPEGRYFEKRRLLYGLSAAQREIGRTRTAVIVEGYTDTIMCHQYGLRNVVATLGTSLTREHVGLLKRYVRPDGWVIALFDADEAGERATTRAIELFMEEDVPLRIVRTLELKDACEYLPVHGAEAFGAALEQAEDAFRFTLRRALEEAGQEVSDRARAVQRVMEVVNRSPDRVQVELMRQEVARAAGVPEASLPRPAPGTGARERTEPRARRGLADAAPIERALETGQAAEVRAERRLVLHLLEREDWARRATEALPPETFEDPVAREVASLLVEDWSAGRTPAVADLLPRVTAEDASTFLAEVVEGESGPAPSVEELEDILDRMRKRTAGRRRQQLQAALEDAARRGDAEAERRAFDELERLRRDQAEPRDRSESPGGD
jgi:DNA primase